MKQKVTRIKDLGMALGDLEPWVKDPQSLYSGKKPSRLALLPREILANWLLCAVGNSEYPTKSFTFSDDPFGGGDGIIMDKISGEQMVTEHVFVSQFQKQTNQSPEDVIIDAIKKKQNKGGKAYAQGKHLIVFCEGIGKWTPNVVGRQIHGTHDFSSIWALGLGRAENDNSYFYWVACFDGTHSPIREVSIDFKQKNWSVTPLQ